MKDLIRKAAAEIGFAAVGVTSADPVDDLGHLEAAVLDGRIASMRWLARDPAARCDPRSLLSGARSVVCCALAYGEEGIAASVRPELVEGRTEHEPPFVVSLSNQERPSIARFARGAEYHEAVRAKLERLWRAIAARAPGAGAKLCVDTSPILEKALAQRAGIGWIGKHAVLVREGLGSWFVLGEIVTDLAIEPDAPAKDRCGACRRCLDACPTQALMAPRTLDAGKCISYLTIEAQRSRLSGPEPRAPHHGWVDGCDACLEACPHGRR